MIYVIKMYRYDRLLEPCQSFSCNLVLLLFWCLNLLMHNANAHLINIVIKQDPESSLTRFPSYIWITWVLTLTEVWCCLAVLMLFKDLPVGGVLCTLFSVLCTELLSVGQLTPSMISYFKRQLYTQCIFCFSLTS